MTPGPGASRAAERRQGVRLEIESLVYVSKMADGVPIVLNLSVSGMAIQAMEVLERGALLEFQFVLPRWTAGVRGVAEIVWTDNTGRAGLQFVGLSPFDHMQLQQWVVQNQLN